MKNDTLSVSRRERPGRILRMLITHVAGIAAACQMAAAFLALSGQAAAQSHVLPLPASQATTVPANGDVNPYGVAFVPDAVPTDGSLRHGGILVSNFNNSQNLQGTGTTIVQISPQGQTTLFFTATQAGQTGLSAALGILSNGIVIAGYLPSTDGTSQTAGPGGLLFIDRKGALLGTLADTKLFDGPWGMTIDDQGNNFAHVFVSNVENGSITRLDLAYDLSGESVRILNVVTVGTGFLHSGDPAAFEVGPSGMAYDVQEDILFVSSEIDSSVYAIYNAVALTSTTTGTGRPIYQDVVHLHGPLDLALSPNGHLLVANSDGRNADPNQPSELVEFTMGGAFVSQFSLDPNNGGAFGLAIHSLGGDVIRVGAVDDNQNVLNMYTTVVH